MPFNKQLPSPGITLIETGVVTDSSTVEGDSVSTVEAAVCGIVLWLDADEVEESTDDWVVSNGIEVSSESVDDATSVAPSVEDWVVSSCPAGASVPATLVDSWADPVVDDSSKAESVEDSVVDPLTDGDPDDEDSAPTEDVVVSSGS